MLITAFAKRPQPVPILRQTNPVHTFPPYFSIIILIMSRVGGGCVTYTTGLQAIERYRWSTHFTVHRYTRTRVLSVHYPSPGNGFISLTVTLNHTWSRLFHHLIPSLPFLLNRLRLPSLELDPLLDDNWLKWTLLQLNSQLLTATTAPLELPVIQPRGGPHGKHRLLLSRIVLGVFTEPLPSNRRPIVAHWLPRECVYQS
jgi:hypothetical protein